MEKGSARRFWISRVGLGLGLGLVGALAPWAQVQAGTVFAQPAKEAAPAPGEDFPESRFGAPPMKVTPGITAGYAAHAVEEMEASDEAMDQRSAPARDGGRGLASVNTGDSSNSTLPSRPSDGPRLGSEPQIPSSTAVNLKGVQEVALIANDLGYFPKTVFVNRDVPVRMFVTGASKNTLCIMMDSFQVRRQVRSQKIEEITFTPNVPGKYRFYCPVNGMEGVMVVKELSSSASTN